MSRLIIVTEGGTTHHSKMFDENADIETFHTCKMEEVISKYVKEISELKEVHIVGHDVDSVVEVVMGAFLSMGGEKLTDFPGLEDVTLPKADICLQSKMPPLLNGDFVLSPTVGGFMTLLKVNYRPTHLLTHIIPDWSWGMNLAEPCHIKTTRGEIHVRPSADRLGSLVVNFQNGLPLSITDAKHARSEGYAWLARALDNDKPVSSYSLVANDSTNGEFYTFVGTVTAATMVLAMAEGERKLKDKFPSLLKAVGLQNLPLKPNVAKAVKALTLELLNLPQPYPIAYRHGTRIGAVKDLLALLDNVGWEPKKGKRGPKPKVKVVEAPVVIEDEK